MRILHAISTCEFAGSERHVVELLEWQAKTHDVALVIRRDTCDARTGGDIADMVPAAVLVRRAGRSGFSTALWQAVRQFRPDIVHTHLGRASVRARLLPLGGVPMVATLHNRFCSRVYGSHDGLVCIAQWQKDTLPAHVAPRAQVIHNWTRAQCGSDDHRRAVRARLGLGADEFVFGAAGRFVAQKGLDDLVRAFGQANLAGTRLVIFGDGPMRPELEAMAGPGVLLPGYSRSLPQDLAALDAFVLPSHREPFGLVMLEAMANGLPILATNAGGVPDILGAGSPWLVPPQDIDALSAGLRRLKGEARRHWDLGRFSLPGAAAQLERFYLATMQCKQRPVLASGLGSAARPNPAIDGVS